MQTLQRLVRSPDHPAHIVWFTLVCTICVVLMVETIFVCCFEEAKDDVEQALRIPFIVFLLVLILDMGVNCFKGVRIGGLMCMDFKTITIKYLKGKFIIDAISVVSLILSLALDYRIGVFVRFAMFLRLYDLYLYQKIAFKYTMHSSILRELAIVIKILLLQLFVMHITGCLFYLVSHTLVEHQYYGNNPQLYWITANLQASPIVDLNIFEQYLWSFYFGSGIISTIVIGDIIGCNPLETAFTLVFIFVGTFSEAYLFQVIVNAMSVAYDRIKDYIKNLQVLSKFMIRNDISTSLQHQIHSFIEFKWLEEYHENVKGEIKVLSKLPKNIKTNIILNEFESSLNEVSYFQNVPELVVREIVEKFKQNYYFKGDTIINPFSNQYNIILVLKGSTEGYFQYDTRSQQVFNVYHSNSKILGTETFTTQNQNKKVIKASTRVVTLYISSDDFKSIIQRNTQTYETFNRAKHSILWNQNYQQINQKCECCLSFTHSVVNCVECHINKLQLQPKDQENQRTERQRKDIYKIKTECSIIELLDSEQKQTLRNSRQKKFQQYSRRVWSKYHILTEMIKNEDVILNKPPDHETMQSACKYEEYFPKYNIF